MRPNHLYLALLLALTLVAAACGDTDPSSDGPTTTEADGGHGSSDDGADDEGGSRDMGHDESSPVADGARRIEVEATSFSYDPAEITVTAGEDIAIVLTSDDLLHDFTLDELDAHVAADKDETNAGGLRADEPGRYTFYCSVEDHREQGMEGTLIVNEPPNAVPRSSDTMRVDAGLVDPSSG